MSDVYRLDPVAEADNAEVLEDMRVRIASGQSFGITVAGNRVTLRWHLHGELVEAHMIVADVVTPAESRDLKRQRAEFEAIRAKVRRKYPDVDADLFHAHEDAWPD